MVNSDSDALSIVLARSFSLRDAVALLIAYQAAKSGNPDVHFQKIAEALQARLDELPEGISHLKENVRAEQDWLVSCAQAFHRLFQP